MDTNLLLRLILAHLLTDFPLQVDWVYRMKKDYAWGVIPHAAIFFAVAFPLTWPLSAEPATWITLLAVTVFHLLIDKIKVDLVNPVSKTFAFLYFLFDQFVHIASMALVAWIITASLGYELPTDTRYLLPLGVPGLWILIGFVILVWFYPIVLMMLSFGTTQFPHRTWGKWERGFLFIGMVATGAYQLFALLALLPRVIISIRHGRHNEFFAPLVLLGSVLAILLGLLIRFGLLT